MLIPLDDISSDDDSILSVNSFSDDENFLENNSFNEANKGETFLERNNSFNKNFRNLNIDDTFEEDRNSTDNIRTNSLEIIDDYPNIHVTRFIGNKKEQYLYKILHLGFYPQQDNSDGKKQSVSSNKSASNVSALFLQQNFSKIQSRKKPFHELQSESQKNKCLRVLAHDICDGVESAIQLHNFYDTVLRSIDLDVNGLHVNFKNLDSEQYNSSQILDSIVCACDKQLISRDAYRQLAAIISEMVCGYKIDERRQEITRIIESMIPVHTIQINSVTNGAYRSLKNILLVVIPKLAYGESSVLQVEDIVHIKLSEDGRQVGKFHNQVMLTACILNEQEEVLCPSNQHCIFLYNRTEQYESLQKAFSFLVDELLTLQKEGIVDPNNNHWQIEFWFGSDWKFMSLVLGIKGLTAHYFCLYCNCKSADRWNVDIDYENSYNSQGQKNLNILSFLNEQHCIPDELHLMLRITDILFKCGTSHSQEKLIGIGTGTNLKELRTQNHEARHGYVGGILLRETIKNFLLNTFWYIKDN
ncbi:9523_t:CDS:2 [Cetraspora pellucida]|uniref:9523_t:CDS:1 n=1 Tax=Cetraspora pellucida TaxID=1433469 RepID=A0ACA9MMR8_9GLOM|nr:9523_t:CDS:2 [Cetraspora pellucida]